MPMEKSAGGLRSDVLRPAGPTIVASIISDDTEVEGELSFLPVIPSAMSETVGNRLGPA